MMGRSGPTLIPAFRESKNRRSLVEGSLSYSESQSQRESNKPCSINYPGSGKLAQPDKEAGGGRCWLPAHQLTAKAAVPMAGLRIHSHHKQRTHVNIVKTEPSMAGSTVC